MSRDKLKRIWKFVTAYPDYMISNYGQVLSLRMVLPRLLRPVPSGYGGRYRVVGLRNEYGTGVIFIHKLVWYQFGDGRTPTTTLLIDHIDNIGSNNRIDNLQLLSVNRNTAKRCDKTTPKSGLSTGVTLTTSGKFSAQTSFKSKQIYLGTYDTEEEASEVYQAKLKELGR